MQFAPMLRHLNLYAFFVLLSQISCTSTHKIGHNESLSTSPMAVVEVDAEECTDEILLKRLVKGAFGSESYQDNGILAQNGSKAIIKKITVEAKDYVYRRDTQDRVEGGFQRQFLAHKKAMDAGVAPRIRGVALQCRAFIMDFIAGEKPKATELTNESIIQLAQTLKSMHAIDPSGVDKSNFFRNRWQKKYYSESDLPEELFKKIQEKFTKAFDELSAQNDLKFIHSDLNEGNCLWDGQRWWVIDWETAAVGNPYMDLGLVVGRLFFNKKQTQLFFSVYLNRTMTSQEQRQLDLALGITYMNLGFRLWNGREDKEISFEEVAEEMKKYKEESDGKIEDLMKLPRRLKAFYAIQLALMAWRQL